MEETRQVESLSGKAVRGGMWVFGLRVTSRAISLLRLFVVARLLLPDDFGLLAMAVLATHLLETFSQAGMQAALVQRTDDVSPYLNTVWTVNVIRGIAMSAILFASAPLIGGFFDAPAAVPIIRAMSAVPLLTGVRNVGVVFFQKEMTFGRQFALDLAGTLTDCIVALSLAFALRSVWALVYGALAGHAMRLAFSYSLHPYRPRIQFNRRHFNELFGFGKWLMASSILVFLVAEGDDIFVGKLLGVATLGLYQMAYLVSNAPATEITHVISKVAFPAYSQIQDNLSRVKSGYLRVFDITTLMSIPLTGAIILLSRPFAALILGPQWLPMVPAMQVLAIWGAIRSIGSTTGPVFLSLGKPKIIALLQCAMLAILVCAIWPLTAKWDILGTAAAVCIAAAVPNIVALAYLSSKLTIHPHRLTGALIVPTLATAAAALTANAATTWILPSKGVASLLFEATAMAISFAAITYAYDRIRGGRILSSLQEIATLMTARGESESHRQQEQY